jgi:hypothetical protein
MTFSVGSLVRARGRDWVVLPDSSDDLLILRPLGGTDDEVTGIYVPLEKVEPATFGLPDPNDVGDFLSCRLLRDAVRFSSRAGAGPFRCFSRIAVEPRPYQLVPLLMALKLDPVRLLIADDVGVGKSVEACLVARELIDRGEVTRLAVLCPPHLAEQWQDELRDKFHIEAELVLPGTASRLERICDTGQSLFEVYPNVIVSMDYIKSERNRGEFLRAAPELIIVDEAHTCAFGYEGRGGRHQRHDLLKGLAKDPSRHLILVTATPHSGKEEAFRSLLAFLREEFTRLPEDLSGPHNEGNRRQLAAHFVQRRRADIRHFLAADTPFPEREESEATYRLSPAYRTLFNRVLTYARETVEDQSGGRQRQRVRWWSALALLRSLASSPAAAVATLRKRARVADTESAEEADEVGRRTILDVDADDLTEGLDIEPGADADDPSDDQARNRRRLLEMAREAEKLCGAGDLKLLEAVKHIEAFIKDGFRPIVFCRFIPTADYLADQLKQRLKDVEVISVTGMLPPADREARIEELSKKPRRVLVCTDCLSEGINLQQHFDAVVHYDLSWNPTRHEQREGRVDRFGQPRQVVRLLTYYGTDNKIDGIVIDVLIRKHKKIRSSLGISVPVPIGTDAVVEAIFEGILARRTDDATTDLLPGFEDFLKPRAEQLYLEWENAAEKEKRSRTMFAQESIKVDEIAREVAEARAASGSAAEVAIFTMEALRAHRATVTPRNGHFRINLKEVPRPLRDHLPDVPEEIEARFELPVDDGVLYLSRTHPIVEGLSAYLLDTALDPMSTGVARRAGAIRAAHVTLRTTVLLVRFRYDLVAIREDRESSQLAEECQLLAFAGAPESAEWLDEPTAQGMLALVPSGNITPDQVRQFVVRVVEHNVALRPRLDEEAHKRAAALLDAHRRVRAAAGLRGLTYRVTPQLPADILGIYVCLPVASGWPVG